MIGLHHGVWQDTACIRSSPDTLLSCGSESGLRDQRWGWFWVWDRDLVDASAHLPSKS